MSHTLDQIRADYQTVRPLSPGAAYLMRRTVALFAAWLGRGATADDLTDQIVSTWLESLESTHAAGTRAGHRVRIMCLWRFAARRGYCQPPGEVRRERPPEPQPVAWTPGEVARLVAACDQMGADGDYLRVEIAAGYESGIRKSDLHGLRREQISEVVTGYRMSKTGFTHEPRLRPETVTRILARPGSHPLACPWGPRKYRRLWARLRALAGVGDKGGLQQLRRTGATWVAVEHGVEAAREYLGHRSPEMVRCYLDRRHYRPRGWLPPRAG
jgi:integrase